MKYLNLGCGAVRPSEPWINLDTLYSVLPERSKERENLDREPNYVDHDISTPLPFEDNQFETIVASHVLEHLDTLTGQRFLKECRRVLKPEGVVVISVPDASYFKSVNHRDTKQNCVENFGEPMPESDPNESFMDYALFFLDHRQIFTHDSLWCCIKNAGLTISDWVPPEASEILNRNRFSLVMSGVKL